MGLTSEIAHLVGVKTVNANGMNLVSADDMDKFLDAVNQRGARILGIDGYFVQGENVIPDMDAIADFSDFAGAEIADTVSASQLFLASLHKKSDLCFDITFM